MMPQLPYASNNVVQKMNIGNLKIKNVKVFLHVLPNSSDENGKVSRYELKGAPFPPLELLNGELVAVKQFKETDESYSWRPNGPYLTKAKDIGVNLHCLAKDHNGQWKEAMFPLDDKKNVKLFNINGHLVDQEEYIKNINESSMVPSEYKEFFNKNKTAMLKYLGTGEIADHLKPKEITIQSFEESTQAKNTLPWTKCTEAYLFCFADILGLALDVSNLIQYVDLREIYNAARVEEVEFRIARNAIFDVGNRDYDLARRVFALTRLVRFSSISSCITVMLKDFLKGLKWTDFFLYIAKITTLLSLIFTTGTVALIAYFIKVINDFDAIEKDIIRINEACCKT